MRYANHRAITVATASVCLLVVNTAGADDRPKFNPKTDLISLHYDHAPDRDDGHSAAADRTILQSMFAPKWIAEHVVAVSGAYGKNAKRFRRDSDAVMNAVWNPLGGWVAAHDHHNEAAAALARRWGRVIAAGGEVWVKEGGQSDLTAKVVKQLEKKLPDVDLIEHLHVVQHSNWNENQTTDSALKYVRQHTDYIRIKDANRHLNRKGGDRDFEAAATKHPAFGESWRAAFEYYNPRHRLDFSDTGELMQILGLGELDIDQFQRKFLKDE